MKLRLIYKCRACGENEIKEWLLPDDTILHDLLTNTMNGSHEPKYGPHGFHKCEDGVRGITDLIGFRDDHLGQGEFCNGLWKDEKGTFCSVSVFEGHSGFHCAYNEASCHVIDDGRGGKKIVAGGGGWKPVGVCEDFESAKWLGEKLGVDE